MPVPGAAPPPAALSVAVAMPPGDTVPAKQPDLPFPVPAPEPLPAASVAAKPEPSYASAPLRSATPSFAGNWLYIPENGDTPAAGSYSATYVEFLVAEEHGELSGSYRARFTIPDQAVSPEVSFRVQGKSPPGESARLSWASPDGARGEVEITLRGRNGMSVRWWTTELGRRVSLASGTANLVRQRAP
jgi:hypothetical protein